MASDMFLKTALGPKEGRLPPPRSFNPADRRRRFTSRQKNAFVFSIVLVVFIIYSVFYHVDVPERVGARRVVSRVHSTLTESKTPILPKEADKPGDPRSHPSLQKNTQAAGSQKPVSDGTVNEKVKSKEPVKKEPTTERPDKQKVQYHTSKSAPERQKPKSHSWSERPTLKDDLEAVFSLLPDEIKMREFLRPIDTGGPERMRELGLRTREYKKYLDAWEKVHLVEDKETGETYVRDDVIQYLRGMEHGEEDKDKDQDQDQDQDSSITTTIHNYDTFRNFLAQFARVIYPFTSPYFADHMSLHAGFKNAGRGIVLTAGDDQAKYLMTTIYTFRELGCDLPIEIMYLGETDLGEDHRSELEALPGVTTRDISMMVDDEGWTLAGWAIKPFAMLLSSFREVIFIDADSLFFKDPAKLFEDPDYKKTGALFFRDRTIMPESKKRLLQQILPRPIHKLAKQASWWTGTSGHHQESGVVVVDKWKHFVAMLLICRFNGSDRDPRDGKMGVYELMHGDKETFWIGFLLVGDNSFAFHRGGVGSIGVVESPNQTALAAAGAAAATATATATATAASGPTSSQDGGPEKRDGQAPLGGETETTETTAAAAEEKKTYTMCSPQLLHLDLDGTPLWFNGWLLVSKYADRGRRIFAPMTSYLREPRHKAAEADDFWQLTTDNMCCLTTGADSKWDLGEHDLGLLKMMRRRAAEVGAMN